MEPYISVVLQWEVFNAASSSEHICSRCNTKILCYTLVAVIRHFDKDIQSVACLPAKVSDQTVVFEQEVLRIRSFIDEVTLSSQITELTSVSQGKIINIFPRRIFHYIYGICCLEPLV